MEKENMEISVFALWLDDLFFDNIEYEPTLHPWRSRRAKPVSMNKETWHLWRTVTTPSQCLKGYADAYAKWAFAGTKRRRRNGKG